MGSGLKLNLDNDMKIVQTSNNQQKIKLSKKEWSEIGKKAGWMEGDTSNCEKHNVSALNDSNEKDTKKRLTAQQNIDEIRKKKTDENVKLCWEAGSAIMNLLESDSKEKFISNDARYILEDARSICDSLAEAVSGEMSPYENRNFH